jgi:hypothetical protein
MLNFSSLFYTTTGDECLLSNIELDAFKKEILNQAKSEIRQLLKAELPKVLIEVAGEDAATEPRFFTQGSWAYKTLNEPAQYPQQADLDDGAYLPLSFVSGIEKPSYASDVYFAAAEKVLTPLTIKRGWKLITNKATCIRIEVNHESHIDIPLYAIPDKEFITLSKAAAARYMSLDEALKSAEQDAWTALPKDLVLLAHREDGWKVSDPRLIKDWFLQQVGEKGEQLRRVVRYLKAYRDHHWPSGGPSSILLMVVAESVFEKRDRRDDMALLDVVRQLPDKLRQGVVNPKDKAESLTARLTAEEIESIAIKYEEFCRYLAACMQATDKEQACVWMRIQFGSRFPHDSERIQIVTPVETIASAAAVYTASPLVGRTQAG